MINLFQIMKGSHNKMQVIVKMSYPYMRQIPFYACSLCFCHISNQVEIFNILGLVIYINISFLASDGQQIYLHSINVRTLEACYGSLEQCPQEISGRIVEKEAGSMTPQLRKRLRYLEHVPITCQFEVIELDLRPPVVTPEALARFQGEF